MKNILVTGHRGFIGFNFVRYMKKYFPEVEIYGVDSQTYAARCYQLAKHDTFYNDNIRDFDFDIVKDTKDIEWLIDHCFIDTIVHFAAESHVDNSISNPNVFFDTNVIGTVNLLNLARKYNVRFHLVSTDEVIGPKSPADYCEEDAAYNPSSPYSSSKASAELATLSYVKTFGVNATISRCTNNFGPFQHQEKFIPTVIKSFCNGSKIPVYGDGQQRRFWIHVDSHNEAIKDIIDNGKTGEIYNIAPKPSNLLTNIDLIKQIGKILGKNPDDYISFVKDRPAHDVCYYLNGKKLKCDTGFVDKHDFSTDLEETVNWYKSYYTENGAR